MVRCETCGAGFEPKHPRARFCSGRCRVAAWQKRKQAAARAPLERILVGLPDHLEELAAEIREALAGTGDSVTQRYEKSEG